MQGANRSTLRCAHLPISPWITHLEVGSDRPPADVNQLGHVVIGIKGPDTALQVQVFVELDGLGLPDAGVKLEGAVVTRPQGRAVVDPVVQEPCLCEGGRNKEE